MGKTKPFISKKEDKVHHFRLVHRSQRDPLIADEDAPQQVLVPFTPSNLAAAAAAAAAAGEEEHFEAEDGDEFGPAHSARERTAHSAYERKARNAELGILFKDDDYDYSQHIRERGQDGAEATFADLAEVKKVVQEKVKQGLVLPEDALPSLYENPVGMLNLAAPVTGPRLDLDPDIAAMLDDEFAHNDDFVLDDDFLAQAGPECDEDDVDDYESGSGAAQPGGAILDWRTRMGMDTAAAPSAAALAGEAPALVPAVKAVRGAVGKPKPGDEEGDDGDDVSSGARHSAEEDDDEEEDGDFEVEETKSRFTEYSMSSSVLPRSEGLQLHDSRFEQLYAQYDEENIGPLEAVEEEELGRDIDDFAALLDEHLEIHGDSSSRRKFDENGRRINRTTQNKKRYAAQLAAAAAAAAATAAATPSVEGESAPSVAPVAAASADLTVSSGDALPTSEAVAPASVAVEGPQKRYDDFGNLLPGMEESEVESSEEEKETVVFAPAPKKTWDCQSLASTHSTLFNHPSTIGYTGPKKKIMINSKGLPVVQQIGAPEVPQASVVVDERDEDDDDDEENLDEAGNAIPRVDTSIGRAKDETPEQRRQRKKELKEQRRERRLSKKETSLMFKQEEQRQEAARRGNAFNPAAGRMA